MTKEESEREYIIASCLRRWLEMAKMGQTPETAKRIETFMDERLKDAAPILDQAHECGKKYILTGDEYYFQNFTQTMLRWYNEYVIIRFYAG